MKYYLTAIPLSWVARGWLRTVSGSCVVRLRFSIPDLATLCHRELQGGGGEACLAPTFLSMSMWIESHLVGPRDTWGLSSSLQHPWEKAGHNDVSVTTPGLEGGERQAPWNSLISQPYWLNEFQLSLKKKKVSETKMEIDRRYYMLFWLSHTCVSGTHVPTYSWTWTWTYNIHTHTHTVHVLDRIL